MEREFHVAHPWWRFAASFNVSPARNVPVIRSYDDESEGVMLRWGLVPDWAEGDAARACATHASAENINGSSLVRGPWSRGQRCIVPAFGFYGWKMTPERFRQPYFIRLVNREVFGIAALWDRTIRKDDDDVIEGCAMLTVAPNRLMAEVSSTATFMPAILHREDYETWLNAPAAAARSILRTYPQDKIVAHAISPRINSLRYDDAGLIESIEQHDRRCA